MANRETEYEQTIAYIHHMYDTRHRIFGFLIAMNAGLLTVIFEVIDSDPAMLLLCIIGLATTLSLTLMGLRANRYRIQVEQYAIELEEELGYGLIKKTGERMPKGLDSTVYIFCVCWLMNVIWAIVLTIFLIDMTNYGC